MHILLELVGEGVEKEWFLILRSLHALGCPVFLIFLEKLVRAKDACYRRGKCTLVFLFFSLRAGTNCQSMRENCIAKATLPYEKTNFSNTFGTSTFWSTWSLLIGFERSTSHGNKETATKNKKTKTTIRTKTCNQQNKHNQHPAPKALVVLPH